MGLRVWGLIVPLMACFALDGVSALKCYRCQNLNYDNLQFRCRENETVQCTDASDSCQKVQAYSSKQTAAGVNGFIAYGCAGEKGGYLRVDGAEVPWFRPEYTAQNKDKCNRVRILDLPVDLCLCSTDLCNTAVVSVPKSFLLVVIALVSALIKFLVV